MNTLTVCPPLEVKKRFPVQGKRKKSKIVMQMRKRRRTMKKTTKRLLLSLKPKKLLKQKAQMSTHSPFWGKLSVVF